MLKNVGLLVFRLAFGGIMLGNHGIPKLLNFSGMMNSFPDPLGIGSSFSLALAIGGELVCPALIILGLFTRLATIPAMMTMFVAVFIFHGNDGFSKMELGLLYFCAYLGIALLGAGDWSLDKILRKKV